MRLDSYFIMAPALLIFFAILVARRIEDKASNAVALAVWAVWAALVLLIVNMHFGGRSIRDLAVGPCPRTEYHRATVDRSADVAR